MGRLSEWREVAHRGLFPGFSAREKTQERKTGITPTCTTLRHYLDPLALALPIGPAVGTAPPQPWRPCPRHIPKAPCLGEPARPPAAVHAALADATNPDARPAGLAHDVPPWAAAIHRADTPVTGAGFADLAGTKDSRRACRMGRPVEHRVGIDRGVRSEGGRLRQPALPRLADPGTASADESRLRCCAHSEEEPPGSHTRTAAAHCTVVTGVCSIRGTHRPLVDEYAPRSRWAPPAPPSYTRPRTSRPRTPADFWATPRVLPGGFCPRTSATARPLYTPPPARGLRPSARRACPALSDLKQQPPHRGTTNGDTTMHTKTEPRTTVRTAKPMAAPLPDADLAALLEPRTLEQAASARAHIEGRQRDLQAAVTDHDGGRDAALLTGGDTWAQWQAEANRLALERERCAKALELIERAADRLEAQARAAEADTAQREAESAQAAGLALLSELDTIAARYAEALDAYRARCGLISSRNGILRREGRQPVALPHDAASEPDRIETETVRVAVRPAGIYDAAGRELSDLSGDREPRTEYRTELREKLHRGRRARDMTLTRIEIPRAMDSNAYAVFQG